MKELQIFDFENLSVRTIVKNGNPWFVATDVCAILGISNSRDAVTRLDDDEKDDVGITDTIGRSQTVTAVNESGLYLLTMTSRKPEAKRFKKWVTSEVLPAIRKTGSYSVHQQLPQTFAEALKLAYEQQLVIDSQVKALEIAKPKADFFDAVTSSTNAVEIGVVAKVLNMGIGRNKLFSFLRDEKVLQQNNMPYQQYVDAGYFRVIESKWTAADGSTNISFKTVVYQKGVDFIRKRYLASQNQKAA